MSLVRLPVEVGTAEQGPTYEDQDCEASSPKRKYELKSIFSKLNLHSFILVNLPLSLTEV